MPKITILASDGCMLSGISGLIDALSIANVWNQALDKQNSTLLFETEIVSIDGKDIHGNGNIRFQADRPISSVDDTDLLIIPPYMPTPEFFKNHDNVLLGWISNMYQNNARIAALCTGVFMLAETGLLDGKPATTNWQFARYFRRLYPDVRLEIDRILTEEDRLICSGTSTSMFSLILYIVENYGSKELASICSKALLVDPGRESQSPYIMLKFPKDHFDAEILEAQKWMETRYSEAVSIDSIASEVGLSPRHFKRRFKSATGESPLGYLQQVRIEVAKNRLETTLESMNEITWQIGYEDSSSFRRLFKKYTGLSPREYRDKFARPSVRQAI